MCHCRNVFPGFCQEGVLYFSRCSCILGVVDVERGKGEEKFKFRKEILLKCSLGEASFAPAWGKLVLEIKQLVSYLQRAKVTMNHRFDLTACR